MRICLSILKRTTAERSTYYYFLYSLKDGDSKRSSYFKRTNLLSVERLIFQHANKIFKQLGEVSRSLPLLIKTTCGC